MLMNAILAQTNNGSAAGGFLVGGGVFFLLLSALYFCLWVYALYSAATNPSLDTTARLIWLLLIFFLPLLGLILYFLIGRKS